MNLLDKIQAAGVAGCGGAGFPTYAKFRAQDVRVPGVETFIVNAAECEPLLRTDRFLMLHRAGEIIAAAAAVQTQLGAARTVIALKESYAEEIKALRSAIVSAGAAIELHLLGSFYPAGDEHVMTFEVTGRVVPPAGLPLDVGCVVSNVGTVYAVYEAMRGIPFTHKFLTVAGAVHATCVIKAPIGTSFEECLALAGGSTLEDYIIICGGPMMGKIYAREKASSLYVSKTTAGFILLPGHSMPGCAKQQQLACLSVKQMQNRARSACIQCSFCTQLCPRRLLGHPLEPHKIMRKAASLSADFSDLDEAQLEDPVLRSAQYCSECGVCELVACPMRLSPRGINRAIKARLAKQGMRPQKGELGLRPLPYRAERAIPTGRATLCAGVQRWQADITRFVEAKPTRVKIALDSHIGAPAVPIVKTGEWVAFGQCIAQPPEGALGVPYHASIAGVIEYIGEERIVIVREGE